MTHRTRIVLDAEFESPDRMAGWLASLVDIFETEGVVSTKILHGGQEVGYVRIEEGGE